MLATTSTGHQHAKHNRVKRKDDRVIIHFDYDCFYASVVEAENPALKTVPLAIQQKQIVVTCNYEARKRGLYKLQLITEAKSVCPDVVIVLGEDLTRFRDASKSLHQFICAYSWNGKVEKLGFDEVWMDVTDIVDYNVDCLNPNHLSNSFFQLSRTDPLVGFPFDARHVRGHAFPTESEGADGSVVDGMVSSNSLSMRLVLGSHLACHIREALDSEKGYTSAVGIATSKLLSKLVGNMHKPNGQTTLLPPYETDEGGRNSVYAFLDAHEIGKIPWIGFKLAQKLRQLVLGHPAEFDAGLVYGGTRENVTVGQLRKTAKLSPKMLDNLLSGPGSPHGIGGKVFDLIHGIDDTDVAAARAVPRQISIEDSYIKLEHLGQVIDELKRLSVKLIQRMLLDLTTTTTAITGAADGDDKSVEKAGADAFSFTANEKNKEKKGPRWLAFPTALRLSTRPRLPLNADGTRDRTFKRVSRSCPVPSFLARPFRAADVDVLSRRLVTESLLPLFRKLHPEKSGWNLSLINIAVTGMPEDRLGASKGVQNIGSIFKRIENIHSGANIHGAAASTPHDVNLNVDVDTDMHIDADADADADGRSLTENRAVLKATNSVYTHDHDDEYHLVVPPLAGEEGKEKEEKGEEEGGGGIDHNIDHDAATAADDDNNWNNKDSDDEYNNYNNNDDDNERGNDEKEKDEEDEDEGTAYLCPMCQEIIPTFAKVAHERFHTYASSLS